MPGTLVSFHAHPDDEALLVVRDAWRGRPPRAIGSSSSSPPRARPGSPTTRTPPTAGSAQRRMAELQRSADVLGVSRVECLGYADSGLPPDDVQVDPPGPGLLRPGRPRGGGRAARGHPARGAAPTSSRRTTSNGGYGHPDHVQVHHVGRRAAELAGTPVVLQATVPRDLLLLGIRLARRVYRFPPEFDPATFERAYSPKAAITHRIDVRRFADAKRASMAAHASQATGGGGDRTLAGFLRMPRRLYRRVFGHEWFVQAGLTAGAAGRRAVRRRVRDGPRVRRGARRRAWLSRPACAERSSGSGAGWSARCTAPG